MLNPTAASDTPRETARGNATHHVCAAKISKTYEAANQLQTMADFKYILGQSRGLRPVLRKYSSTRFRSVCRNPSLSLNFKWPESAVVSATSGSAAFTSRFTNIDKCTLHSESFNGYIWQHARNALGQGVRQV